MAVFSVQTLTPVWTGGIDRSSAVVHETGILGSLRWWYEGVVRGLGGRACDPTDRNRCTANRRCAACDLFGCTGWRRRFRIEVSGLSPTPVFFFASPGVYVAAGNWLWRMFGGAENGSKSGRGTDVRFSFGAKCLWAGEAQGHAMIAISMCSDDELRRLAFVLWLMTKFGGIGARPQHGFGITSLITGIDENERKAAVDSIRQRLTNGHCDEHLFSIERFFSREYVIPERAAREYQSRGRLIGSPEIRDWEQRFVPCAFDIRYKSKSRHPSTGAGEDVGLRPQIKRRFGSKTATILFGESRARTDEDRRAGRIGVSGLFRLNGKWRTRIWGDLPPDLDRAAIFEEMDGVMQHMFDGAKRDNEREFDFSRDVSAL